MNLKRLMRVKDAQEDRGNQLKAQTFFVKQNTDNGPASLYMSTDFNDVVEHLQYYQRNYKAESFFLEVVFNNNDYCRLY